MDPSGFAPPPDVQAILSKMGQGTVTADEQARLQQWQEDMTHKAQSFAAQFNPQAMQAQMQQQAAMMRQQYGALQSAASYAPPAPHAPVHSRQTDLPAFGLEGQMNPAIQQMLMSHQQKGAGVAQRPQFDPQMLQQMMMGHGAARGMTHPQFDPSMIQQMMMGRGAGRGFDPAMLQGMMGHAGTPIQPAAAPMCTDSRYPLPPSGNQFTSPAPSSGLASPPTAIADLIAASARGGTIAPSQQAEIRNFMHTQLSSKVGVDTSQVSKEVQQDISTTSQSTSFSSVSGSPISIGGAHGLSPASSYSFDSSHSFGVGGGGMGGNYDPMAAASQAMSRATSTMSSLASNPRLAALVMKKMKKQPLTPQENFDMKLGMMSTILPQHIGAGDSSSPASSAKAAMFSLMSNIKNAFPVLDKENQLADRQVPDLNAYTALVRSIHEKAVRALPLEEKIELDKEMSKIESPFSGAVIGLALFVSRPSPRHAVYTMSTACLQKPLSAEAANNLAVVLQTGLSFLESYDILLYARGFYLGGSPSIESSLGFAAMYYGDGETAVKHFDRAIQLSPNMKEPYEGKALILFARNDHAGARALLRKSLARGHSMVAAMLGALSKPDTPQEGGDMSDSSSDSSDASSGAEEPSLMDDPGYAATAGNLMVMGGEGEPLDYPVWDCTSVEKWAESFMPFSQWIVRYRPVVMQLFKERDRLVKEATVALEARNRRWAAQGAFPRIHARVEGLIDDEEDRCFSRANRLHNTFETKGWNLFLQAWYHYLDLMGQFTRALAACGGNEHCIWQVKTEYKVKFHNAAKMEHGGFASLYNKCFYEVQKLMQQMWKRTNPLLDSISCPEEQAWLVQHRETMVRAIWFGHRVGMVLEWSWLMYDYLHAVPDPGPEPVEIKEAKTPKPKGNGKPFPPYFKFGIGPVTIEITPDSIALTGGEGIIGGAKYQWGHTLSGQAETTLSVGVGVTAAAGPLSATAGATVNVTFVGQTPVDVGVSETFGVGMSAPNPLLPKAGGVETLSYTLRSGANIQLKAEGTGMSPQTWDMNPPKP